MKNATDLRSFPLPTRSIAWWRRADGHTIRRVARCVLCGSRRTVAEWCNTPARPAVSGRTGAWPASPAVHGFGVVACDACGAS